MLKEQLNDSEATVLELFELLMETVWINGG
jgi:hypothetical protein